MYPPITQLATRRRDVTTELEGLRVVEAARERTAGRRARRPGSLRRALGRRLAFGRV
jgi:hypothetical protein